MRIIISVFMVILALSTPARADDGAIKGVISGQIEAFKSDDFDTAFTFASPTIQGIFRDPDNFGAMVKNGYPMVWRPADVQFLSLDIIDGELWQSVMIKDEAGQLHILEYNMVNGENGWKINAVRMRPEPVGTA